MMLFLCPIYSHTFKQPNICHHQFINMHILMHVINFILLI